MQCVDDLIRNVILQLRINDNGAKHHEKCSFFKIQNAGVQMYSNLMHISQTEVDLDSPLLSRYSNKARMHG